MERESGNGMIWEKCAVQIVTISSPASVGECSIEERRGGGVRERGEKRERKEIVEGRN